MPKVKVQFAIPLVDVRGKPINDVVQPGFAEKIHGELRAGLVQIGARDDVLAVFDDMAVKRETLTVGGGICVALANDMGRMDARKYLARNKLIRKIQDAEEKLTPLELEHEAAAEIQKVIAEAPGSAWLKGQMIAALEGNVPAEEPEDSAAA